ncbi:MAG TPA: aminotransferase class I/II-fold pyridoxal phosphate-dependent enzyme [Pseudogracilibacillus sp.]|nr:aminotransferase class I/II-fold pyridoxal phosphate-dependent enzyme [Pseudogracilibacillus sp.]
MSNHFNRETILAQIGNEKNEANQSVSTPIYLSTAYRHQEIGQTESYDYTRTGNPTRDVLESQIAKLEKGNKAFACSSGMAAIQLIFAKFKAGSHFIVSRDIYGGSYRLFENFKEKYNFSFTYWNEQTDLTDLINSKTEAIFIETPTNPLMKVANLKEISQVTKENNLLLIVDSTLFTPYFVRPIEFGANIVIHSASKYLGGHNDILAGLIITKDAALSEEYAFLHNSIGSTLSPFDCFNLIRGLKTLAIRMDKHLENAKKVVDYLQTKNEVTNIYFPGNSGMVSFEIQYAEDVSDFLKSLKLISFAESLGGVESFITYPITQTHMDIPAEIRESYGLTDKLLRISVGIEHADDIINDFEQAFERLKERIG